jgi:hypothetical protein
MFGTRLFHLLLLALALACVSSALAPEVNNNALEARQDDDSDDDGATISIDLPTDAATSTEATETSVTESAPAEETSTEVVESTTPVETSTTEAEPTTSTEEPVEETSSTEVIPESTTSTTINQPTSEADPATTESEDSVSSTTTEAAPTSTEDSGNSEEEEQEEETSTTKEEPVTSTSFQTITRTNSAGELETTTSASVTTSDPELSEDGGDSGGLPTNTRNIIIGVVVGVGGAIILGALGIVAWRIRARKKLAEENDGLMEYNGGYTPVDKSDGPAPGSSPSTAPTGSTRTPFQSTLENYHQPSQPVNASSNF